MKWLKKKWNQLKSNGWKYAIAIVIGYALHLMVEGFIVNIAYYSFIKPTYIALTA